MERKPRPGQVLRWAPRQEEPAGPGDDLEHRSSRLPGAAAGDEQPDSSSLDKTGAEEHFYKKHMLRRTGMVVVMQDGQKLRGWIEWYDRTVIKLHSLTEPNRFIAKDEIKYIYKHADEPGSPEPIPTPPPLVPQRGRERDPFKRDNGRGH